MLDYPSRRLTLLRHPSEIADRAINKLDALREQQPPYTANGHPTREELRAHARRHWGYRVTDEWESAVARLLGVAGLPEGFDAVWQRIGDEMAGHDVELGNGLDADVRLARTAWSVVRTVRPKAMVETGVSRGILTRVILEAMAANGTGHLWSIDLPPLQERWQDQSCAAVRDGFWPIWTYLRGSSRWHLRRLLRKLGTVDVFLHDSQHTERNMTFELGAARPHVRPGGLVIADDVHENGTWRDLDLGGVLVQEERKGGIFALARV